MCRVGNRRMSRQGDIRKLTFPYTDRISGETTDIPLKDIAEFEEGESLNVINRSSQTRYISVTAGCG